MFGLILRNSACSTQNIYVENDFADVCWKQKIGNVQNGINSNV